MPAYGVGMAAQGFIADQAQLLQVVINGLGVYNTQVTPLIARLSRDETREVFRVSQAPLDYEEAGDGSNTHKLQQTFRLLTAPLKNYQTGVAWTVMGLQDSLPSDVIATLNGALAGDVERQETALFQAMMTKRTAGAVGTAYQASWYNGETDVPAFKNTSFSSAHSHFIGTNTATLSLAHLDAAAVDIREHGYGMQGLWAFFNSAQETALKALLNITVASSLTTPQRIRAQDQGIREGITYAGIDIFIEDNVPAGYFLVVDPFAVPVVRRVHPDPSARGLMLFQESFNEHFPLAGRSFLHRFGFAIGNLAAGAARQIVASTTYTNPTWRIN